VQDSLFKESKIMQTETRKHGNIVNLVLKAVAVAMGIAVVTLGVLGAATTDVRVLLLGIGLACLALTVLDRE
jgi:hypothetical protein